MSGVVLDLDKQIDSISRAHLIDDLTYPTSVLEISFLSNEADLGDEYTFVFAGARWKMNSASTNPFLQANQYSGLAVIDGALDPVKKSFLSTSEVLGSKFKSASGRYSVLKFKTPIHGDTLAVILRNLQFQSFEENYTSLQSSYCLSLTSQGFVAGTWNSLCRISEKFQTPNPMVKPELLLVKDENYFKYDHVPLPGPLTQESYFNQLFGNKITLESNVGLSIGKAYTFDLNYWGLSTQSKYLLIRQELTLDTTGSSRPYKQVFAEVRSVGRYN